jgi:hypothetical protein
VETGFPKSMLRLLELRSLVRVTALALEAPMKRLVVGCCIAMIAGPCLSQARKREPAFYVLLNTLTRQCTVADKLPTTDTPTVTVVSDTVYETRAEAEVAIRTLKPCMP